jgi:hypothetical protein
MLSETQNIKNETLPDQIVRVALGGLAACMLLSWGMWGIGDRSFPCLPVWGDAVDQTGYINPLLFGGLCALLIGGIIRPGKAFLLPLVLLLALLCGLDLNRLQPWTWFFLLVSAIVSAGKFTATTAMRWLLAAVYCWGGVNKLTPYFAEDNFRWFCEVFESTAFLGQYPALGYAVAVFEIVLGVMLIWPKENKWFRWIYVVFHALIIISLLKARWNYVVIPWNAALAAMAFLLLSGPKLADRPNQWQWILLFLAGVMPLANLFHSWPHQLSWQLYSNTQPEAVFYCTAPCVKAGDIWRDKAFDEGRRLLLDDWSIQSLGVPMFYSDHTFRQMGRYLCACVPEPDSSRLIILTVNPWNKQAERSTEMRCGEMK